MDHNFILLLIATPLIVIASFSLVFSFDPKRTTQSRKILLLLAILLFIIIGIITAILMKWPM